jgi:hypothetical protein
VQNQKWWGMLQKERLGTVSNGSQNVRIGAAHVRDGLSSTFMLFESAGRPDHFVANQKVPNSIMGDYNDAFRWAAPSIAVRLDETCYDGQLFNCQNWDELYSFHRGGIMVVMGDGATHFLIDEMDPEVFVSLYTMQGGDIADVSQIE